MSWCVLAGKGGNKQIENQKKTTRQRTEWFRVEHRLGGGRVVSTLSLVI